MVIEPDQGRGPVPIANWPHEFTALKVGNDGREISHGRLVARLV
jgi:hypothetical protein